MSCYKIGCKNEAVKEQEVAFRNHQGYIIRTKIGWCKDHAPACILEDFSQVDLLKDGGY